VDMSVTLLTAERQDVDPLCIDTLAQRFGRFVDCSLESKIFLDGEIACHLLLVLYRSDQCVSVQDRILVEEYDNFIILMDDVVAIQISCNHLTDKARAILNCLNVRIKIKGFSSIHGWVDLARNCCQKTACA